MELKVHICDMCKNIFYDKIPLKLFIRNEDAIDNILHCEICMNCYNGILHKTKSKCNYIKQKSEVTIHSGEYAERSKPGHVA